MSQPGTVLAAGQSWGDWAVERSAWQEAAEGYGYALQAVDELLSAQLMRRFLGTTATAASGAASVFGGPGTILLLHL